MTISPVVSQAAGSNYLPFVRFALAYDSHPLRRQVDSRVGAKRREAIMRTILLRSKPLAYVLIVAVLTLSLPRPPAEAALGPTESALNGAADPEADRARVRAFLSREDVQAHLQAYGISAEEALARVDSLRDDEVALIAGKLDQLPAGADPAALTALFAAVLVATVFVLVGIAVLVKWAFEKVTGSAK